MCCFAPPLVMGGRRSPKLQLQFYICPVYRKRNFVEGLCCFAPPLVMGGRRSPKLQLQFLHLPCLQETEFCGRIVLFCPTSSDGRSPVPKVTTAVFTFALFTGNGILWKECVVLPHL
ncbi:hypothetical protein TNCV_1648241 [Trichonephila clavipes]|uniref:Uncharacterized protein n=1 Tax=Trichonephila clavipes TaxID=2585209 RepID=A0A8X6RQ53_TRICX|nr:hypothetical protein TNCV_1648241 [Trichonephila clavipes]